MNVRTPSRSAALIIITVLSRRLTLIVGVAGLAAATASADDLDIMGLDYYAEHILDSQNNEDAAPLSGCEVQL